jgi:hypothetical protein
LSQPPWRQQLSPYTVTFAAPASPTALAELEAALGLPIPAELRSLLAESNGLEDRYRTGVLWPAAEIARRNQAFRTNPEFRDLYMPFEPLLFFGDVGNGDQFFYRVLGGAARERDVYVWDHETDSRIWRAPTLRHLLADVLADR